MRVVIIEFPGASQGPALLEALAVIGLEAEIFAWDAALAQKAQAEAYILISDLAPYSSLRGEAAYSPLLAFLRVETSQGKPLLALGRASAFVVETGLVPGLFIDRIAVHLEPRSTGETDLLRLSPDYQYNAFTRGLEAKTLVAVKEAWATFKLPIGLWTELVSQGQNVFSYCDSEGQIADNGSAESMAALSNKSGNVLALVPDLLSTGALIPLLQSLKEHLDSGFIEHVEPLYYWPRGV